MDMEDEFANAAAALFTQQITRFSKWLERGWRLTERDNEASQPKMTAEYMRGWNAALESIPSALELYMEPDR